MQGLLFSDTQDLSVRFAPIVAEFESLWWFVDFQSGPFSSLWIDESEANQRRFEQIHFPVPVCENTSSQVWRPSTLPELVPYINFGEWSYLVGFEANENQVERVVNQLASARSFTSPDFFAAVQQSGLIYIIDVDDGWLEVYSPQRDRLELLHQQWPSAQLIESSKWHSGT